jgi:iron complex transport system substrate-binding protein
MMEFSTRALIRAARLQTLHALVAIAGLLGASAQASALPAAVTSNAAASRIVSLAPNLTEIAFAAGAGDSIVGTVEYSDYPEAAKRIARVGDAFMVDFERVIALRPDVVLAWESGTPKPVIERLRTLRLRVQVFSTYRVEDVARVIREVGEVAGTSSVADPLAAQFEQGFKSLRQEFRGRSPLTAFIQINARPLYTVNSKQILSEIVEMCGGRNVFGFLNDLAPQISVEAVLAQNPQVILSVDETATDVLQEWQRWNGIEAVRTRNVFALPANELARATPRLLDGARSVCRALETARQRRG